MLAETDRTERVDVVMLAANVGAELQRAHRARLAEGFVRIREIGGRGEWQAVGDAAVRQGVTGQGQWGGHVRTCSKRKGLQESARSRPRH
ncbi:hypothetical protein DLREEDagr8_15360 [Dongia sp. agr-C8]